MLISIITICKNDPEGLRHTAESIICQSSKNYEWIVKNGGSDKETENVLNEYSKHLTCSISEPDDGIYDAMNRAVQFASGSWLLFLNAGDVLKNPNVIEKVYPYLAESRMGIVVGEHIAVLPDGEGCLHKKPAKILDIDHFFVRTVNHQSTFISQEVFSTFGPYDTSYKFLGDYDFFVRAVLGGAKFEGIPVIVVCYDRGGISSKMKGSKAMNDEFNRIRRHYSLDYKLCKAIKSNLYIIKSNLYKIMRGSN